MHAGSPRIPLKRLLKSSPSYGVLKPEHYAGPNAVPLVRVMNVDDSGVFAPSEELLTISPAQDLEYRRTKLEVGDLVISVVGTVGRVAPVQQEQAGYNVSRALARLQMREEVRGELVMWWLRSRWFRDFVELTCQGTAQAVLNMADLANFRLAVVGLEQSLEQWSQQAANVMTAQDLLRRRVALLAERKQALITAAVTGHFDVTTTRSAA